LGALLRAHARTTCSTFFPRSALSPDGVPNQALVVDFPVHSSHPDNPTSLTAGT
jgi:hypothetical protein